MEKRQRNQGLHVRTGREKTYILTGCVVLLLVLCGVLLLVGNQLKKREPLEHDATAKSGVPVVDEGYLYGEISNDFGYSFGIAANLYQQEDGSLMVYLVNPQDSETYLMCKVKETKTGKVLYQSGLVNPGEYVEKLEPAFEFPNEDKDITISIYAFEPDTLYSMGTTSLSSVLHKW